MKSVCSLAAVAVVLCTTISHQSVVAARRLEDGDNSDKDGGNFVTQAMGRVKQDLVDMWDTSPGSWVAEYWEVFAVAFAIIFGLVLCHCAMCYDVCVNGAGGGEPFNPYVPQGVKVRTAGELSDKEKKVDLDRPILDKDNNSSTGLLMMEDTGGAADKSNNPTALKGDGTMKCRDSPGPRHRKSTLWSEAVSVWREFLGIEGGDTNAAAYHKYQEPSPSPRKANSNSPRRQSKKGGDTTFSPAEMVTTPPAAAGQQKTKVEKYQGMIV